MAVGGRQGVQAGRWNGGGGVKMLRQPPLLEDLMGWGVVPRDATISSLN